MQHKEKLAYRYWLANWIFTREGPLSKAQRKRLINQVRKLGSAEWGLIRERATALMDQLLK